jgi:hypothetical protein
MSRFTRSEADEQYSTATSTLRIAKQSYEHGGSPDLLDTQHLQAVADWLSAAEERIASYRDHLLELIHGAEALSDVESGELAAMLAEIAYELFPKPGRTLFDKRSLAARATGLDSGSVNLKNFRVALADLRDEITVLVEWYDWYRGEAVHDPAGMFSAIRKKHDLTKRIAVRFDKIAVAFDRLHEEAARNKGGSSGNGS